LNSKLEAKAKEVRREIFDFKTRTGIGHLATSLSCVDMLISWFYDNETTFDHTKDIVLFGKAHGSPSIYPILAEFGYYPKDELDKYCTPDGILRLHSDGSIPGCHFVGGSLGNGIGYASGLAFANRDRDVYIIMGDAELYEGSVWESLIFIAHHKLTNLKIIVDRNGMGTIGETEKLLKLEPLKEKFEGFGFHVNTIDGHDFDDLRSVYSKDNTKVEVTIAETVKGKGVSYMEGDWRYHVIIPKSKEDIEQGLKELS
jgi:transketolase